MCLRQALPIIFSTEPAELNYFLSKKPLFGALAKGLITGKSVQSSEKGDLDERF